MGCLLEMLLDIVFGWLAISQTDDELADAVLQRICWILTLVAGVVSLARWAIARWWMPADPTLTLISIVAGVICGLSAIATLYYSLRQ